MPVVPLSQLEESLKAQDSSGLATVPLPADPSTPQAIPLDEAEAFHDTPITTADAPKSFWEASLGNVAAGFGSIPHMVGAAAVYMGDAIRPKGLTEEFGQMVEAMPPEMREPYTEQVLKEARTADTIGKSFIKAGYALQDNVNKFIEKKTKESEGAGIPPYVQELEQMGGGMAGLIGVSILNPLLGVGGMTVGMAAEGYQNARLKGKDFEDATRIGAAIGIASGTPAFVGLGAIMKLSGPIVQRLVGAALIQGGDMALMRGGTETVERFSGVSESKKQGVEAATEVIGLMAWDASMAMILSPATGMAFAMQKRSEIKTELKKTGLPEAEAIKTTDAILAKANDAVLGQVEIEHKLAKKGITRTEIGFADAEGKPILPERVLAELSPKSGADLPAVERARLVALEALPQRETLGVTSQEKALVDLTKPTAVGEAVSPEMARKLDLKFQKIEERFRSPEAITKQRIKALQSEMDTFIRSSDLEAADKAKFLATIKQVQTFQQLRRVLPDVRERISGLLEKENLRNEIARFQEITARKDVNKTREEYQSTIKALTENLSATKVSVKKGMALDSLAKHIEAYPETILPKYKLDELASLDKKSLRDMTSEEVGLINDAIEHLYKLNDAKTRILGERKYVSFEKSVVEAVKNIKTSEKPEKLSGEIASGLETTQTTLEKIKEWQGITTVKPETNLMAVEGKDGGILQNLIFGGMDRSKTAYLRFERAGQKILQDGFKGLDLEKWSQYIARDTKGLVYEVFSFGGEKLKLTKAQTVSLHLLLQREGGARHLLEGGFSIPGKEKKVYKMTIDDAEAILDRVMADAELQQATTTLHSFFNGFMKGGINRVAYALTGIHIAKDPNYFKIKVNPLFIKRPIEQQRYVGQVAIEGMGFLKEAVPSKLPIMLEDAFSVAYESLHHAGTYIAYAEPLRAAKSILRDTRVQIAMPKEYYESFNRYLRRIEGEITSTSAAERGFNKLMTNVQSAILMLNPKILLKQPVSVFAGLTEMNAKYLLGNYGKPLEVKDLIELEKYSPQLFARWNGHISRELGELKNEGAIRELFTGKTSWSEKFMTAYQTADHPMVSAVWRGAKAETMDKFPDLKGPALMEKVAERAEFMVRRTQAAVFLEHRSEVHAGKSFLDRSVSLFSSETNTQQDMLVRSWREYLGSSKSAGDNTKLAQKVLVVSFLNSFLIANINAAANILLQSPDKGRKDEEKKDWELIGKKWVTDLALGPLSAFYVARDIAGMIQSQLVYGSMVQEISNPAFQVLSGAIKGAGDLLVKAPIEAATKEKYKEKEHGRTKTKMKWEKTFWSGIKDLAENIGLMNKIPVPTLYQWGNVFINAVGKAFGTGD